MEHAHCQRVCFPAEPGPMEESKVLRGLRNVRSLKGFRVLGFLGFIGFRVLGV